MNIGNVLTAFSCFLILIVSACTSPDDEIRANQNRAGEIIQAISNYTQEYDQFPGQLDDLQPTYISKIPKTTRGENFNYRFFIADYYELCFEATSKRNYGCCYSSYFEDWECSFGEE